jgi:isoquinoline 1-oxidoreductase alpha subunit
MRRYLLTINGRRRAVETDDPDTPLLWALRDHLGLTGTKYGCGVGICGACTVHVDGQAMRSCQVPVSAVPGHSVRTIEGLSADGSHPCQRAWLAEDVSQCGFCQPGMIMSVAAALESRERPSVEGLEAVLEEHVCRCGTYGRVRKALRRLAADGAGRGAR